MLSNISSKEVGMATLAEEAGSTEVRPVDRLEVLFDELAELCGQRNAIDGRIVDIVAECERDSLRGITGARSLPAMVAWKTGISPRNAHTIAAIAERQHQFPRCAQALREGRLSLDQVGAIAERAADGSDEHYAQLAAVATVSQLRTAIALEPPPPPPRIEPDTELEGDLDAGWEPAPPPTPPRSITSDSDEVSTTWRITLPHDEAATFSTALDAHRDALIAEWTRARTVTGDSDAVDTGGDSASGGGTRGGVPMPTTVDAFLRLVECGWDAEATRRPHGQHTTVVVHLDLEARAAALHLGPLLADADRQYLTCDATCEVWFERDGRVIGAGRVTRTVNRRLRRALEHRDRCCVVPGCGATRGLHAHHVVHWEDGGRTDLDNLVLVCPYHHRAHHRGLITISGSAHDLLVTDHCGRPMHNRSLARPPTTAPPAVPPYPGPTGERADWWWYQPFEPEPPPPPN